MKHFGDAKDILDQVGDETSFGGTETESEPHDSFFSLCHVLAYAQISVADVGLHEKLIVSLSGTYGDGMTRRLPCQHLSSNSCVLLSVTRE